MRHPSPADRQVEANDDVERIAREAFCAMRSAHPGASHVEWAALPDSVKAPWRMMVRGLLQRDLIRVGARPQAAPPPMDGQVELDAT